jgi:hypothetical protein
MKKASGLTILEVLISSMIFALVIGMVATVLVSFRSLSREFEYRYVALNLARECLEFAEAREIAKDFKIKYYYPRARICTIPGGCNNPADADGCPGGLDSSPAGYKMRERWSFCPAAANPFIYLGDIKARKLVPKLAPDSVVIYYKSERNATLNCRVYTAEVTWQVDPGGPTKKETLSVIPIRQINDQLRLGTAEFWWE